VVLAVVVQILVHQLEVMVGLEVEVEPLIQLILPLQDRVTLQAHHHHRVMMVGLELIQLLPQQEQAVEQLLLEQIIQGQLEVLEELGQLTIFLVQVLPMLAVVVAEQDMQLHQQQEGQQEQEEVEQGLVLVMVVTALPIWAVGVAVVVVIMRVVQEVRA
jgi:hypothetical protein